MKTLRVWREWLCARMREELGYQREGLAYLAFRVRAALVSRQDAKAWGIRLSWRKSFRLTRCGWCGLEGPWFPFECLWDGLCPGCKMILDEPLSDWKYCNECGGRLSDSETDLCCHCEWDRDFAGDPLADSLGVAPEKLENSRCGCDRPRWTTLPCGHCACRCECDDCPANPCGVCGEMLSVREWEVTGCPRCREGSMDQLAQTMSGA